MRVRIVGAGAVGDLLATTLPAVATAGVEADESRLDERPREGAP